MPCESRPSVRIPMRSEAYLMSIRWTMPAARRDVRARAHGGRVARATRPRARSLLLPGSQLDRLAVWRGPRGRVPVVDPLFKVVAPDDLLRGDETLEGGKPVLVVTRAVIGLAARGRVRERVAQRARPLRPAEDTPRVQRQRHCERLRLPGGVEGRSRVVARQRRQRGEVPVR